MSVLKFGYKTKHPYLCSENRLKKPVNHCLFPFGFHLTVYKKHYPPALRDEVWRLEKIGKDGSFHKRLNKAGIFTVEDFLRLVSRDSQRLRNVRLLRLVL